MKILIDADGCPVVNLTVDIAKEFNLDVIIVKNHSHFIENDYASIVTVDKSRDSADYYIANHSSPSDIIITQDYGLSAMVLSKGAIAINQNGLIIDDSNIGDLLDRRHLNQELRRKHKQYSKFKKRKKNDNEKFEISLRNLLERQMKSL